MGNFERSSYPWNLEGFKVSSYYLDRYIVTGTVEESRVKYGGSIQHRVKLDKPLVLPWCNVNEERTVLLIDDFDLREILE